MATPLGNLGDMSSRGIEVLGSVTAIAAEDTRRTRKLLSHFGIRTRLVSFHEHNEDRAAGKIVARIEGGDDVALVSDAGTPLVADPGYRLVSLAASQGVEVVPVPGPAAVTAALSVSGLPVLPFYFLGFPPRKPGARRRKLADLKELSATLVLYESPHRIARTLADLLEVLGDRRAVVARELTKVHEEILRGRLSDLAARAAESPLKGEIVVVVEGADRTRDRSADRTGDRSEEGDA